ncbi:class I SAM-dependent methyltransferase [Bernardetia sp.]|uniref:class I SAM-dependent methyltransferase n=1 Tax=Bernardetia sp. TaxID=1937974 RepID=UPI0025B97626|nr:SAM-dependent methyltransferase [Bernardetia sp.]
MLHQFTEKVKESLENGSFIKITLSNFLNNENQTLKKILIRKTIIKREENLTFVYRNKTNDITKNYTLDEGIKVIITFLTKENQEGFFNQAILFTTDFDLHLKNISKKPSIFSQKPTQKQAISTSHDKQKKRAIQTKDKKGNSKSYLQALKITDPTGKVYKNAQDKYKQINQYIEILSILLKQLPSEKPLQITDMGAGKGYLTFALHDYLKNNLKLKVNTVGVEFRKDLVELCNEIAVASNFENLSFVEGTIEDYQIKKEDKTNILIALHACDTATDDAIFKGIEADAELIVVAPCCHKQIRREIEKGRKELQNQLSPLTNYGIFLERQAEMLTDTMRCLLLNCCGYQTKAVQFISDTHTPKNVLLIATKKTSFLEEDMKAKHLKEFEQLKSFFGIEKHYLEQLILK